LCLSLVFGTGLLFPAAVATAQDEGESVDYDVVTAGTRVVVRPDGSEGIKMLVEAANLGSDNLEIAELTFPPNSHGRSHAHHSIEIFYVLSGQLTHVVNGRGARLTPGMVGIVRPGDTVEHIVEVDEPTRVLVIWAPGGEADRILSRANTRKIDKVPVSDFPADAGD